MLCAIRGTEYMTMIVVATDSAMLESIEALAGSWGCVHTFIIIIFLKQIQVFLGACSCKFYGA